MERAIRNVRAAAGRRLGAAVVVLAVVGCSGGQQAAHDIAPNGTAEPFRICFGRTGMFFDLEDGVGSGIEHDLLTSFAETEGRVPDLVRIEGGFESVFDYVDRGDCDVAAYVISATPQRAARYDLTRAYFPVRAILISLRSRQAGPFSDLNGLRVASQPGQWFDEVVAATPGVEHVPAASGEQLEMLSDGRVDALVADSIFVPALLENRPELMISGMLPGAERYVFLLPKGSPDTPRLDAFLVQQRADGGYRAILERYLDEETADEVVASLADADGAEG